MNAISLAMMGPFQIKVDGRTDVDFRTRKVQALLIYLAVEPAAHNRDLLLNLLWPGLPEKSARSNLRQILYYLRQILPEAEQTTTPFILANRQDIQLNPEAPLTIDTRQLESLVERVNIHTHMDIYLCRKCHQHLQAAVDLYRGNFLSDFYLDDSNEFEEWALARREYFSRRVLDALETLTTVAIRGSDYAAAQTLAERQLEIDNLRENAYRQLMEALARNGQREQALAIYNTCRRVLAEELGMAPTTRTNDYYEKILAGDVQFDHFPVQGVRGYELKEEIGSGAYGAIHRAIQPAVEREVAVKVINRKHAADPEFIRRFESEAQTVAQLEHPYIVPLYDYWRDPEGAYLVMRYMRGGSLLDQLRDSPWSLERIAGMLDQLAGAFSVAHNQGIVHRDIKPGNILLDEAGNCYLADFGIAKDLGREEQITAEGSVIGTLDYISPEQIIGEPVSPQTDIYSLGAVLYEALTGEKPYSDSSLAQLLYSHLNEPVPLVSASRPDISPDVDAILQKATAKKPVDRFESVLALSTAFRRSLGQTEVVIEPPQLEARPAITEIYNPYKGLHAFQETDEEDFFGREALVQQLVERLAGAESGATSRFLAIVGPSGSGKSSVVKAGLIPSLRHNALPGADKWFITEMVPGNNPFAELESALWHVAVDAPPNLVDPMRRDTRGIMRTLERILPLENAGPQGQPQLLLIIDQFEEIFTLVEEENERLFFLDSLMTALEAPRSRLRLVVTLRADFYDRPLQYQEWGPLLKQRTEVILPLNRMELTWAVREPARRMGVALEEDLAAAIVSDVANQPGALPLLQYAMTALFEQRQNGVITRQAYNELGGVKGALGHRAEKLYNELPESEKEIARQLFFRLITLGEGVEDTRRRVQTKELERLVSPNLEMDTAVSDVLERFGDARFLSFDHDPTTRLPTVEIAHEALLREWPRLRDWLANSREDIRRQRMLAQFAGHWTSAAEDNSYLLRGSRLLEFESWLDTTTIALTEEENEYVYRSIAARDKRNAEEDVRQQRELETAQQLAEEQTRRAEEQTHAAQALRQRAYMLSSALLLVAILSVAAVLFARSSNQNANRAATEERKAVIEREIAVTAQAEAVYNLALASTSEAEAVHAQQFAQEEASFRATAEAEAIENQGFAEEQLGLAISRELALAARANLESNPELSLILSLEALKNTYTAEAEEALRTALQESRLEMALTTTDEYVRGVDYHPSGGWIAGIRDDGVLLIWDAATGNRLDTIPLEITIPETGFGFTNSLDIAPDGTLMAVVVQDSILVLNTETFAITQRLEGHTSDIWTIEFSPDSRLLASGDGDGFVKLWQTSTGVELFTGIASSDGGVDDVSFSHDGSRLATAGDDVTARLWDVATGVELATLPYDARFLSSVEFTADDSRLFSSPLGIGSGRVNVYDIEAVLNDGVTEPLVEWSDLYDDVLQRMELSSDGRFLFTLGQSENAMMWDVTGENPEHILTLAGHNSNVSGIAISPDDQQAATISDGRVHLWNISAAGLGEVKNIADYSFPIDFRPNINRLITIENDGAVKTWDTNTGELLSSFDSLVQNRRGFLAAAVSPDGVYIARGADDGLIRIWNLSNQEEITTLPGHGPGLVGGFFPGVIGLDYSPDGTLLASGGADGYVLVWDMATYEKIHEWRADPRASYWSEDDLPNGVIRVKFSPDGQTLAAATDAGPDGTGMIKLWDLATGEERILIENVEGRFWGLEFSSDGQQLAGSASFISVLDVNTNELISSIPDSGTSMSFFANDTQLITSDGTIWDIERGEAMFTLPGAGLNIMSKDGQYLVATGENGLHFYTLNFNELLSIAQSRITRGLIEAECKEYLHLDGCP